jgi:DAK2 domain fusion protein YloV
MRLRLCDLAGLDAGRADVQTTGRSANQRPHPLNVGVPATLRPPVRVAELHSEARALAANLAYRCHGGTPMNPCGATSSVDDRERIAVPSHPASRPAHGDGRGFSIGPMDVAVLDAAALARAVVTYRDALRSHQEELNRLNVYPVPDGDTGTNMALTVESVVAEMPDADDTTLHTVCRAMAHGSLLGARGNSGVILSQVLRGFADTFAAADAVDATVFTTALRRATDAAYDAVMRPIEGTILTVLRCAAEAAEARMRTNNDATSLTVLLEVAHAAAERAVEETPELLPVLKEAGVVDAGGRGFVLLLDSVMHVVMGRAIPEPEVIATPTRVEAHLAGEDDVSTLRYEVMYLLEASDETIGGFREAWLAIGDSIVIVGGDGLWNCHIHTNDIGAAIEAGIDAGRPMRIRVTDLFEQVEEEEWVREHETPVIQLEREYCTTAVVAVGMGPGIQRLLASLGVQAIVAGGQSMNPSTAQIREAVHLCRADSVVVLPNNKNIIAVAEQVDGLSDRNVAVVRTTAIVEALAALVEYDPHADLAHNVASMTEAFTRVRSGEVTQAVRDTTADGVAIRTGDWIAVTRDGIRAVANTAVDAAMQLVDALVTEECELVTLLVGADARPAETIRVEEHLRLAHPRLEIEIHEGGQPLYPYLIGVE